MYLATVIDCYSRHLTGFAIADHIRTDLVLEAIWIWPNNTEEEVSKQRFSTKDHAQRIHITHLPRLLQLTWNTTIHGSGRHKC